MIKKVLFSLFILSFAPQFLNSQTMTIHTATGNYSYTIANIDSITFLTYGDLHDPILAIQFQDYLYNHNIHIASDGQYLYTVNGGSASVGRIKRYTLSGTFVDSVMINIDMRSIMYNRSDGYLYIGSYDRNIYKLTNYSTASYSLVHTALYDYNQASPAMSWDGLYIYAFYAGTLKKYNLATGALVETISGLSYGAGSAQAGDGAVAVDQDYIYTWNATTKTVYVYTLAGSFVRTIVLPSGDFGYSLSFVDGYLFAAVDGNYSTGTWYGYNIRLSATTEPLRAITQSAVDIKETINPKYSDSTK